VLALGEEQAPYYLNAKALEALRADQVPEDVLAKLAPVAGEGFRSAGEMSQRLGEVLAPDELSRFKGKIVQRSGQLDRLYILGLLIFSLTVVGYTLIGGFLAAVWTDLFQSVMMLIGVVVLLLLALPAVGGMERATRKSVVALNDIEPQMRAAADEQIAKDLADGKISAQEAERRRAVLRGVTLKGDAYASGPGYSVDGRSFLPPGLAFSFFFVWVFAGLGSPASIVRVMASRSTEHIRRSIFVLNAYNVLIYIPLVMVCICGRALFPQLPPGSSSDEIIPLVTLRVTDSIPGGSLLAGLVLAAPFGAVMATVSGYLVVIASAMVRDVYQRFLRPQASTREIRRLTYSVMIVVGVIALAANINPVEYLQAIVVFSGTGGAATFVVPALMTAYWRRATASGAMAAMAAGGLTTVGLYLTGFILSANGFDPLIGNKTNFRPYFLLGLDPIVWGLCASLLAGVVGSWLTKPPDAARVSRLFDAQSNEAGGQRAGPG
jgi:SSS family solute:Na+ symporter/sodium/pantothenate symporter